MVRADVGVWFELHGCIVDKKRRKRRNRKLTDKEWVRKMELEERAALCELDPEDRDELGFLSGLQCNPMQQEIGEIVKFCRENGIPCRIVTYKGRQQGSSTMSIGVACHELRRHPAKCCIIGDEFEKSVKNLKQMFHDFVEEDKFAWGNTFVPSSGKFSHGSELVTETANDPRAGASGTMQVLICTEVAHWKETGVISAAGTFAALLNCVPEAPDTVVIVESTPNGASGVYYDTFMGACSLADYRAGRIPEGWNGYFRVSYFWHQHAEYDLPVSEAEAVEIMATLSDREQELVAEQGLPASRLAWRRKMVKSPRFRGDEDKFEEEYPADEVRGFLLSGRRTFAVSRVQQMKKAAVGRDGAQFGELQWANDRRRGAAFRLCSEDEAICKVMEKPRPGLRYVLPVDPATGATVAMGADPDNHGAGVIRAGYVDDQGRWCPPMLVARLADCFAERKHTRKGAVCRWEVDLLAERVAMLSAYYGGALVVPEANAHGLALIEALKRIPGVPIYERRTFNRLEQREATVYGWKTDAGTRAMMLDNLKRAVRTQGEPSEGVLITDPVVVREFETMVTSASGKDEAMGGSHDDQVMMMAIGLVTIESARVMPWPVRQSFMPAVVEARRDLSLT